MVVLHGLVQPLSTRLPVRLPRAVVEDFWLHSWLSYSRTLRRVVVEHPAVPDLEQLSIPCTLLYGTKDQSASREALQGLLLRNSCLDHVELPGTHHLPARQPERVAEILRGLLAGLDLPGWSAAAPVQSVLQADPNGAPARVRD